MRIYVSEWSQLSAVGGQKNIYRLLPADLMNKFVVKTQNLAIKGFRLYSKLPAGRGLKWIILNFIILFI
jgi:hypothetical protein